jgi:hypothetical protein
MGQGVNGRMVRLERRLGMSAPDDDEPPRWFPLEPTVAVLQQLDREHYAEGLGLSEDELHRAHVAEAHRRLMEWWRGLTSSERTAVRQRVEAP